MFFSQNGLLLMVWLVNEITGKAQNEIVDEPWPLRSYYRVSSSLPVVFGSSGSPIRPTKFRRPTTTRRPFRTRPPPITASPVRPQVTTARPPVTSPKPSPPPVNIFSPPFTAPSSGTLPSLQPSGSLGVSPITNQDIPVFQRPPENVPSVVISEERPQLNEGSPVISTISSGVTNIQYPETSFGPAQQVFEPSQGVLTTTTPLPLVEIQDQGVQVQQKPLPTEGSYSLPEGPQLPQIQPVLTQEMAQPPFTGQNIPPNPPPAPTSPDSISQDPHAPLVFPVVRPPSGILRPPFRPRPPQAQRPPSKVPQAQQPPNKVPQAQPPFNNSPFVPPKPPPVPTTSTSSFAVSPNNGKPERPLPPSRPFVPYPLPLPKPPFELTTTEKPELVYSESSMSDDGNYSFDFLVSNSVFRKEQGFLKKSLVWPGHLVLVKTGAYAFTSPDGVSHRVDFVADENGYRAFESTG